MNDIEDLLLDKSKQFVKEFVKKEFIPQLYYNTRGFYFVPMRFDYSKILYLGIKKAFNGKKN